MAATGILALHPRLASDKVFANEEVLEAERTAMRGWPTWLAVGIATGRAAQQAQLQQRLQDSEAALAAARADATTKEAQIRAEAHEAAQAVLAEKLAESEVARAQSEAALQAKVTETEATKAAAEQKALALQGRFDELQQTTEVELTKLREDAIADAARIRLEAIAATEASMRDKILANEPVTAEATAKAQDAESRLATLTDQHDSIMNERLNEQREILEKAKSEEINGVKAKAFEENQKQVDKLNEMQRTLEKKTNEELGEGAEVNLFESLKAQFPDDRITRIGKGVQGADVLHVVILNGKDCGTIIYDSKNHGRHLSEHVTKLRTDQLAAKAEHAILSTRKFPAKASQLHIEDGVVLANPARVVALVTLIRQHMIQAYTLRMSGAERESKMAALYDFITSDRYTQFLSRVDANAQALLELQVQEKKFHDKTWKKEGELIKQIQKTQADLSNEISCIIGTAADDEPELEETEL